MAFEHIEWLFNAVNEPGERVNFLAAPLSY